LAAAIIRAGENIDRAVVVGRAEDVVEEDPAVEEAPADVAHHGAQEAVDLDDVAALRPGDVGEVLVAAELEAAEAEARIAGVGIGPGLLHFRVHDGHCASPSVQISFQRLTVTGPSAVWMIATAGAAARMR